MTVNVLSSIAELIDPATVYGICVAGFVFCTVVLAAFGVLALLGDLADDAP